VAAIGTIWVTRSTAKKQIAASREEADKVIDVTREQTSVTAKQTETTVRLEREREASEASAFHAMLKAAMVRVLDEAAWARKTYPQDSKTGVRPTAVPRPSIQDLTRSPNRPATTAP
jgi:hypothetical protein